MGLASKVSKFLVLKIKRLRINLFNMHSQTTFLVFMPNPYFGESFNHYKQ